MKNIFFLILPIILATIAYVRYQSHHVVRMHRTGNVLDFGHSSLEVIQPQSSLNDSVVFRYTLKRDGECGIYVQPPSRRPCTPPMHYHPHQTEIFYVMKGVIAAPIDGNIHRVKAGDSLRLAPNITHTFYLDDSSTEDFEGLVTLTPGGPMGEAFFENFYATVKDESWNLPKLLYLVYENDICLSAVPERFQPLVHNFLKFLCSPLVLDCTKYHKEYTSNTTLIQMENNEPVTTTTRRHIPAL